MEKFPFSVGIPDFWLLTSPFDWGLLLLTKFSNWNMLSFYFWLLKLRNLCAGLTKYSFGWDFFKGCFLLVECNHWLQKKPWNLSLWDTWGELLLVSLQTDSCTRTGADGRQPSYLLLFPDAENQLWCSCWKETKLLLQVDDCFLLYEWVLFDRHGFI